jgi:ceramide glucosyltransferase
MIHLQHGWVVAVLVVATFALIYYLLACFAALSFSRLAKAQASPTSTFEPPVSVLKPVHGVDFASYENYASFCTQDYPDYEILFAVNDQSDAAVPVITRLIADYPQRHISLFVGAEYLGANKKVNNLARLTDEAKHEVLALSDGDVRVGPKYLRNTVASLCDSRVGAVTSFYRGIAQNNLFAELEAVGASGDFFAGVLMAAWTEGVKFALGAAIVTTKTWMQKIGGFEAIAAFLADDYEIGHRIAQSGGRILLAHETVSTMYPAQTLRGFWLHQLRWARTVRLCRPASYAALLFTQGLPWVFAVALVSPAPWIAATYFLAYFVLRLAMAWIVGVYVVGDEVLRRRLWLVPLWDTIHFLVWVASFASNRVVWGNIEYEVDRGRMKPVAP